MSSFVKKKATPDMKGHNERLQSKKRMENLVRRCVYFTDPLSLNQLIQYNKDQSLDSDYSFEHINSLNNYPSQITANLACTNLVGRIMKSMFYEGRKMFDIVPSEMNPLSNEVMKNIGNGINPLSKLFDMIDDLPDSDIESDDESDDERVTEVASDTMIKVIQKICSFIVNYAHVSSLDNKYLDSNNQRANNNDKSIIRKVVETGCHFGSSFCRITSNGSLRQYGQAIRV